jgi:biotin-(acetyl-CoA carboxylase) ligase
VIGLGLNLANSVPETGINLSQVDATLAEALAALSLAILQGLADALSNWLDLDRSWTDLLPEYRRWLDSLGQSVKLPDGQGAEVLDVLPNGNLLLRSEAGSWQEAAAGEIQLGYAAVGLDGAGTPS